MTDNKTILLVDDTPANLRVLTSYLADSGFNLRIAVDGYKALELIQDFVPDIILMDVMMPEMDGYETCRRLKELPMLKEVPVIFITALSDTASKVKSFQAGGVDYIHKPLQQEEVLARIQTHLMLQEQKAQLQAQATQLKLLNATKDRFFAIIAHDLRNPFASLNILTDMLQEEIKPEQTRLNELVRDLSRTAKKSYYLVQNLLEWAQLQRHETRYEPVVISLAEHIGKQFDFLSISAQQKNIRLCQAIAPDAQVYADPDMLATILRNLLTNAIKFTPPGGQVEVSVQPYPPGRFLQIRVADTGIGLSEKAQALLFKIDQKFHTSGTAKETGSGLGLILCKEMIVKHGGTIWVESKEGQGTAMCVTLPTPPEPAQ